MRIPLILMLSATLISLTACSSVTGNVVPKTGPSMEQVYDSMSKQKNATNNVNTSQEDNEPYTKTALEDLREEKISKNTISSEFHKIPNPELQMYVYSHLAGHDQIPVPGYTTVFNVYERNHYEI